MPSFTLPFEAVASGVSGTPKTIAAVVVANTTGHRCRIDAINVGPADGTPADRNVRLTLNRVGSVSGGSAGTCTAVTGANMGKKDPGSVDSLCTGGVNYSAEPSTYDTEEKWAGGLNAHGTLIKEWPDEDGKPVATKDMLIGLIAESEDATAVELTGSIEFTVF